MIAPFGATEKDSVPLPWPLADDVKVSQLLSLVALHEHSRSVETVTLPVPPSAGKLRADEEMEI